MCVLRVQHIAFVLPSCPLQSCTQTHMVCAEIEREKSVHTVFIAYVFEYALFTLVIMHY